MSGYQDEKLPIPTPRRLKKEFLLPGLPSPAKRILAILAALALVPLVLIWHARVSYTTEPRIQLMQDMGVQPRYGPQAPSPVYADGRAMRLPVAGTVARETYAPDDHFDRGYRLVKDPKTGQWKVDFFTDLPPQVAMSHWTLNRGRTVFNIYCAVCHGLDARGDGMINQRATELQEPKWIPPANLTQIDPQTGQLQFGPQEYPDGKLFNTITHGIRNMPAYGPQIETADRWAVVAYVRALQLAQHATLDDVPSEQRGNLR